jgi:hypothetical protein
MKIRRRGRGIVAALSAALVGLVSILLAGCAAGESNSFGVRAGRRGADARLERACQLTEVRCSRCHPLERVLVAKVNDPSEWEAYVSRMRRTPGSGIRAGEEPTIVSCLVHHSFGPRVWR